jgi:predicted ATPase
MAPESARCSRFSFHLSVPQIHSLPQLDVNVPVTFFVGENAAESPVSVSDIQIGSPFE